MVAEISGPGRRLNTSEDTFDAIVVGSGATGGVAAMEVLVLSTAP